MQVSGIRACVTLAWSAVAISAACAPAGELVETPLTTVRVASGLSMPLYVTHSPGDSERLFIVEQSRQIKILRNGAVLPTPFLDVTSLATCCGEAGLLGFAFHPNYQNNGYFYINYTDTSSNNERVFRTVVARYSVSSNRDVADPNSAVVLLRIDQPYSNHNGGWMDFGPDGYLYIATGDGGDRFDPDNNAQDITDNLLGKIVRIDVNRDEFPADPERNYGIPPDNPFVDAEGDDEIWAYGLRNPWRNSFDSETGDLYIADVGQFLTEEINVQPADSPGGENYGWDCTEGASCTAEATCTCNDDSLTAPVHVYNHNAGRCSITGGLVYRGCAIPDLTGTYFFADYCSAQIFSFRYENGGVHDLRERTAELAPGGGLSISGISSFGRDIDGEIYLCDIGGGEVFKVVPAGTPFVARAGATPPDGAIDARQPSNPDGTGVAAGWQSLDVHFEPASPCPEPADFSVTAWAGAGPAPVVDSAERIDSGSLRVRLDRPITPVSRVTLTYIPDGGSVTLGWLPGDVNGDGTSAPADILAMVDALNGVGGAKSAWQTDVDRSGVSGPPDILRVIDLLNGAGVYATYNGVSLP